MEKASSEKHRERLKITLANIIKKYRLERKKSIYLISNEIGMTRTMWNDLEHAIKDPQFSTLWRISEALEIPLSKIILELESELGRDFSLID